MSSRTTRPVIVAWTLIVCLTATAAPQARLKGIVHTPGNDPLVAREQVIIEGAGKYTTDDGGEFEFDLEQGLKVGQPARFHVHHLNAAIKIQQWIVVRPCDLKNGRKDALPDVGSEPIDIVVLPRGDPQLTSLNKDYGILGCIIEEVAAEFKSASDSGGAKRSSLFYGGASVRSEQTEYQPFEESLGPSQRTSFLKLVEVAYGVQAQQKPSVSSFGSGRDSTLLDQDFLTRKAAELGLKPEDLADFCNLGGNFNL